MTEEKPSDSGTEPESTPPEQTEPAAAPTRQSAGGGKALAIIALLLALAAGGVAGYLWYQVKVEQRIARGQEITDIKNSVNNAQVAVTALEKEFESLRENQFAALRQDQQELGTRIDNQVQARLDELQSAQQSLSERSASLSGSIEKVYEDLDRSLDTWALEEVEQLLRIANHSLQLSGDVSTAVAGLELADRRLEELGNPAFLKVRERLAETIAELKSLETVDIPGLTLRLSGMAGKVSELPLAQETERPISGPAGDDAQGDAQGGSQEGAQKPGGAESGSADAGGGRLDQWLESGGNLVRDLGRDLGQLVRIQNTEAPPEPLLAPKQRYFLYNNLQLMLSGAQIAALRKDTTTFQDNLKRAADWIQQYFDTEHGGVQQILEDIQGMSEVELKPELPDISDSLAAFKQAKQRVTEQ